MKSKSIIEVNGRRYNATTGALLGSGLVQSAQGSKSTETFFRERKTTPNNPEKVAVRVITNKPKPAITATHSKTESIVVRKLEKKPEPTAVPVEKVETVRRHAERTVNHVTVHTPQGVKTPISRHQLIERRKKQRSINHAKAHAPQVPVAGIVRKPTEAHRKRKLLDLHSPANHTKARVTQDSLTLMRSGVKKPTPSIRKQASPMGMLRRNVPSLIVAKPSVNTVDESRMARAKKTDRSPFIARHKAVANPSVLPTITPLAVQPVPVKPEGEVPSTAPAPQPTNKPDSPTDIFEHALANATNYVDLRTHNSHFKKQARLHITSMAMGTLALLVIAGFAIYQNTPGIQFRVASIRAGVSTNMPNFHAAGFAYDGVKAGNGTLTLGFNNTQGDYQLAQTNTNLSSTDMIQSIGSTDASGAPNYRTLETGDTIVYRFDNTGATWVSAGKWYTVTGNSSLSDSQVESLVHNI